MLKKYEKPEIKIHGNLKEITKGSPSKGTDGSDIPNHSASF